MTDGLWKFDQKKHAIKLIAIETKVVENEHWKTYTVTVGDQSI